MSNERSPGLSLFLDILHTLEAIDAPYMIIGAFAATVYGITRITYDIDIVVDLSEEHIEALVAAYPPPRYYADPVQMRDCIRRGDMFNIMDTSRGEKADLVPLTMASRYGQAFQRRVRQRVEVPGVEPFEVWCARPDDVIVGKLMAWAEGRSRKHETDIYEMMVFHYLRLDPEQNAIFDEAYVDAEAETLGAEVIALWEAIKDAARQEANRPEL
ncbi:MAG: nucleotidyl transferase AbiEii/AbiGii toxin family protein [Anaerolineae bacterium]|nr:nucleotidyl transferase AbiEii/AbiGii toxin family protein [Anaerolineae bacterium]